MKSTLPQAPAQGENPPDLSQWFTEPALARAVVRWAGLQPGHRVLEPSAGDGAILRELPPWVSVVALDVDPELAGAQLEALAGHTLEGGGVRYRDAERIRCSALRCDGPPEALGVDVSTADFLTWTPEGLYRRYPEMLPLPRTLAAAVGRGPGPVLPFDVAITNPPDEGQKHGPGAAIQHIERASRYCSRVVAIVRANVLHSQRRGPYWAQLEIRRLVFLLQRPRCRAGSKIGARSSSHGAKGDSVVLELERARHPRSTLGQQRVSVEHWERDRRTGAWGPISRGRS